MKAKEKEEVKEIVQETIKEQTEPIKTELKKEKKDADSPERLSASFFSGAARPPAPYLSRETGSTRVRMEESQRLDASRIWLRYSRASFRFSKAPAMTR